jgi:hypothetical protein
VAKQVSDQKERVKSMLLKRMSLALSLVFGLVTSQAPEFAQQYFQRLGGAIDELAAEVAAFDADTSAVGLSRDQGVAHLRESSDQLARGRGDQVVRDSERLDRLRRQQEDMRGGAPLSKLRVVLSNPDARVARGAYADFEPALPLTSDGAICAAGGFILLLVALRLIDRPLRRREKGLAKAGAN